MRPAPAAANVSKKQKDHLVLKDGQFTLQVDSDAEQLNLTDAGHRFEALARIVKDLEEKVEAAEGEDKEKLQRWLDQAMAVPITLTLYFDGDAQRDFVNLQLGRAVDSAHMLSLKIQQKMTSDPAFKLAFETAKILNKQEGSPFHGTIRFDSRGVSPLPISTLCSKGSSDIATSLIGLGRVGLMEDRQQEAAWLAYAVTVAFKELEKSAPDLLESGKVLATIANQGTKGSATMMIGVGVCLAYRMQVLGNTLPVPEDMERLVDAAKATLDQQVAGNFGGPRKRALMGDFAKAFLADLAGEKHHKLPKLLLQLLSASTFGVEALPKAPKTRKTATIDANKPKKGKSGKKKVSDANGCVPGAPAMVATPISDVMEDYARTELEMVGAG